MTGWDRFIAWVDADIVRASPGLKGWASIMFALPLLVFAVLERLFRLAGTARLTFLVAACLAAFALFAIWHWRVIANIRG